MVWRRGSAGVWGDLSPRSLVGAIGAIGAIGAMRWRRGFPGLLHGFFFGEEIFIFYKLRDMYMLLLICSFCRKNYTRGVSISAVLLALQQIIPEPRGTPAPKHGADGADGANGADH